MQEQIIGGAKIPNDKVRCEPTACSDSEREPGEREAERQELSKRLFFSGDPATALLSLIERVRVLEERLGIDPDADSSAHPADKMLDELEAVKAKIDERPPAHEEPPAAIADMFDPNLSARQNQEALTRKYAALMSERELCLSASETSKAMDLLHKAERIESGINWNRARLAEAV